MCCLCRCSTIRRPSSRAVYSHPLRWSLRIRFRERFDPAPMYPFGSLAERDAVKDLSNYLGGLGDRHSGAVEEQVAVGKRNLTLAHGLQFAPPRILLQYGLFLQAPVQIESAGRHDQ